MVSLPLIFGDIAGSEILLILVFVLMFFGSKSIPGIAQSLGRTIRQIKDASSDVQNEIKKSTGDMRSDFNLQRMIDETKSDIQKPFIEHSQTLDQAINFDPPKPFISPTVVAPAETPALDEPASESLAEQVVITPSESTDTADKTVTPAE